MDELKKDSLTAEADGIIEGRNAVIEALRAGETIDKIYLQKGETDKTLGHIASRARAAGVVVVEADRRKLDAMSRTHAHQGVIALAAVREYVSVESILDAAREKGEDPLVCAQRELSEEVGAEADELIYLGKFFTSPGYSTEVLHMYLARGLRQGQVHPDEDEFLESERLPFLTLFQQVMSGEIEDGKTIAAVLKTKLLLGL